jgi:hypothetical protein
MREPDALPDVVAEFTVRVIEHGDLRLTVHVSDTGDWSEKTLERTPSHEGAAAFAGGVVEDAVRRALTGDLKRRGVTSGKTLFRSGMNAVAMRHLRAQAHLSRDTEST